MLTFPRARNRTARSAPFAAAIALALLVSGCSPSQAAAPSAPASAPQGGSGAQSGSDHAFVEWQLKLAACVREQGVDFPDPTSAAGQDVSLPADMDAFLAASEACRAQIGPPPATHGRSPEQILEWDLALAACLRENGIPVDDPKIGESVRIPDGAPGTVLEQCFTEVGAS